MASTHSNKRREQTAGARSDLGPVLLGPPLRLLAPQHRSRNLGQITGPVRYLLDIRHLVFMLRHTGYR